jgi:ribosome-associated protein
VIYINATLSIPEDEPTLTAERSSGPGGQHVNKVSTRIVLEFDVVGSPTLDRRQKDRIRQCLAGRITRDGRLRLSCQRHRSQTANRREAITRFAALVRAALRPRPRRRSTKVPRAERRRRLDDKRHRSRLKQHRTGRTGRDD